MKWNSAEQAMAKLEELYPDREVRVISGPAPDVPPEEKGERQYSVAVRVGSTVGASDLGVLSKVRDDVVGCELAIGPTTDPEGGLEAILS